MAIPIINPPVPLMTPIPGGFLQGKTIRILGSVTPSPTRFEINLHSRNENSKDLALHVNPRFHELTVVMNSIVEGSWDKEDRHGPSFSLQPGQGFEILIFVDSDEYKIAINNEHYDDFPFRTAAENVSHLEIEGDIIISSLTFGLEPTDKSFLHTYML